MSGARDGREYVKCLYWVDVRKNGAELTAHVATLKDAQSLARRLGADGWFWAVGPVGKPTTYHAGGYYGNNRPLPVSMRT